jgi:hypothetical protein
MSTLECNVWSRKSRVRRSRQWKAMQETHCLCPAMLQEITGNVYVLVDFILHSMMTRVQKGELEATILARVSVYRPTHRLYLTSLCMQASELRDGQDRAFLQCRECGTLQTPVLLVIRYCVAGLQASRKCGIAIQLSQNSRSWPEGIWTCSRDERGRMLQDRLFYFVN